MTIKRSQPILFSVRESARFPRALWQRFTQHADRAGHPWIDVLRQAIEQYLDRHGAPPHARDTNE